MVGDRESAPKSGVLTSPNYPHLYPSNHVSTQIIAVREGRTIRLRWTNFNTEQEYDNIQITDGLRLLPQLLGSSLPPPWNSTSNIVKVEFSTDMRSRRKGWRLEWTEQWWVERSNFTKHQQRFGREPKTNSLSLILVHKHVSAIRPCSTRLEGFEWFFTLLYPTESESQPQNKSAKN